MTRKRRRLVLLLACGVCLGSATALTLAAFNDNLVFFVSPADIEAHPPPAGRLVRLGGLVEAGSVEHLREDGKPAVRFRVTDGKVGVPVELYRRAAGPVPRGAGRGDDGCAARRRQLLRLRGAGQARRDLHAEGGGGGAEEVRPLEPGQRPAAAGRDLEHDDAGEGGRSRAFFDSFP